MMKFILLLLLFISHSSWGQDAESMLKMYQKSYYPTLLKRHELFLQEYHKVRLLDVYALYRHNVEQVNKLNEDFMTLNQGWSRNLGSVYDAPEDLSALATMKSNAFHMVEDLKESTFILSSLEETFTKACHETSVSWMNDRFLPTRIYEVPHYQFDGKGGSGDITVSFGLRGNMSYGEGASSGHSVGPESENPTDDVGMYTSVGAALGSYFPGLGTAVGAAIGYTIGSIISGINQAKDYNDSVEKMEKTFGKINELLNESHLKVDKEHERMVSSICKQTFQDSSASVIGSRAKKSKAVLSQIIKSSHTMEEEWKDLLKHHKERYGNHKTFLELISEGYGLKVEERLSSMHGELITLNSSFQKFYTGEVAPAVANFKGRDAFEEEKLLDLKLKGEALFNNKNYPIYGWETVNDILDQVLEVR
jgi:hypothetical protein